MIEALKQANAWDFISKLDKQINTYVGVGRNLIFYITYIEFTKKNYFISLKNFILKNNLIYLKEFYSKK